MPDFSPRHKFSDWPNLEVPAVAAGVYVIWNRDELVYCGMSGREFEKVTTSQKGKYGLITRLASHASGRLSGDQFCVYVANRLVIPSLKPEQFARFATGELTLDRLTKTYIAENLEYQFASVQTSAEAYALERECREGLIFGVKPLLNPAEPEIDYWYPKEWEKEYRATGIVQCWRRGYPDLFDGSRGIPLELRPDCTLANFSTYGLMYLVRRDEGFESLTYFRLCEIGKSKDGHHGNREALHKQVRQWMGDESFIRLRDALRAEAFDGFTGEPDLFCWNAENGEWFFAEAKGRDSLTDTQRRWFAICRQTLPGTTIKVCRLRPLPARPALRDFG